MMLRGVLAGVLVVAGAWAVQAGASARCFSVRVQGCGQKARICVQTGSTEDATRRAREGFRRHHHCPNATVTSYGTSCNELARDRCDLRL